jgi:hypothetical protein
MKAKNKFKLDAFEVSKIKNAHLIIGGNIVNQQPNQPTRTSRDCPPPNTGTRTNTTLNNPVEGGINLGN